MNLIDPEISDYAQRMSSEESDYLKDLHRATHLRITNGRMISSPLQGRLLSMISKMLSPDLILDVGTFTGYSALCLAEGLTASGRLITMDRNEELGPIQKEFIARSPFANQIERQIGDATPLIQKLEESPDLIFLDADKASYLHFWNALKPKMKSGSVLLADNVLWYGKVVQTTEDSDPSTAILQAFNETIQQDEEFEKVMLPIRDGLTLIRKR